VGDQHQRFEGVTVTAFSNSSEARTACSGCLSDGRLGARPVVIHHVAWLNFGYPEGRVSVMTNTPDAMLPQRDRSERGKKRCGRSSRGHRPIVRRQPLNDFEAAGFASSVNLTSRSSPHSDDDRCKQPNRRRRLSSHLNRHPIDYGRVELPGSVHLRKIGLIDCRAAKQGAG